MPFWTHHSFRCPWPMISSLSARRAAACSEYVLATLICERTGGLWILAMVSDCVAGSKTAGAAQGRADCGKRPSYGKFPGETRGSIRAFGGEARGWPLEVAQRQPEVEDEADGR